MSQLSIPPPERSFFAAREAAVKLLWDKRSMLPEHSEEIVEDVLTAALPFLVGTIEQLEGARRTILAAGDGRDLASDADEAQLMHIDSLIAILRRAA